MITQLTMRDSSKKLLDTYQIRKTKKQKEEFRNWLHNHLGTLGFEATNQKYSKSGTNIIVGDINKAQIILTAHYDTQPNFFIPMFMGIKWVGLILSQLILVIPIFLIIFLISFCIGFLTGNPFIAGIVGWLVCILFLLQMTIGIANKHTANDNTSGVATLIAIAEELSDELRDKVCFVFFDQEELGLIGSASFKKKYKEVISEKTLINFDCVSDGDNILFIAKKKFRKSGYNNILNEAVYKTFNGKDKKGLVGSASKYVYASDQIIFENSVGVAALKESPTFGYYLDRIHTRRDTRFDTNNIELIKDVVVKFVHDI